MTITINDYFFLEPDWVSPIMSKRVWRTAFQTTIKEQEKRSALFTYPRRGMQLTFQSISAEDTNYVVRKLYKNMHNIWGIPFWAEGTALTSQAASGQAILNVGSTLYRNFEVGGKCVVLSDKETYEAGTISSMDATSITLDSDLTGTWNSGLIVYPILKCRMGVQQASTKVNISNMILSMEVKEEIDPDITHVPLTTSNFPVYNTFSVFNKEPNWISPLGLDLTHNTNIMQFLGIASSFSNVAETNIKLTTKHTVESKEELNEFLAFFDDCRGRWQAFWLPSFNSDIIITSAFVTTDVTFDIQDIKYSTYWDGNDVIGKYLHFLFPDGSVEYREVISAPSSTEITIDSAIGKDITADELSNIVVSFLFFVRFDIDELGVNRVTDEVTVFDLKFSTIYGETI